MKKYLFPLTLVLLLLISVLAGCAVEQKLDAAEDKIENKLDAVEDYMENEADRAPTVTVTPASGQKVYSSPTPDQITEAEAMEIALQHSGYTAEQVQYLHTEYEINDGVPQYDVQFYADQWEYEYEIHAENGSILSFDKDD